MISAQDVERFETCIREGGVVLFPADTVYGLACDPDSSAAIERLYEIKGRPARKPSAVMFFSLDQLLAFLEDLEEPLVTACKRLLPGPVTLLLPNPARRFPLACLSQPETLGVRVPLFEGAAAALAHANVAVLQSSANSSGQADAKAIDEIDPELRAEVDLTLDAGVLPGTASTVIDLTSYGDDGKWEIVRSGPLDQAAVAQRLVDIVDL